MNAKRFEGKNLEEALDGAAKSFGVERFRVSYHVVLEKRGFLGGTKRVVIEAEVSDTPLPPVEKPKPKEKKEKKEAGGSKSRGKKKESRPEEESERPDRASREAADRVPGDEQGGQGRSKRRRSRGGRGRRSAPSPETEPAKPAREVSTEVPPQGDQSEEAAKIARWCEEIFAMSGLELVSRTTDRDDEIAVELYGQDVVLIDQEAGDFLDSLQVLANKAFTGRQIERRIEFDAAGFKERRERELSERARELADRVREEGRERTMRAMTPIERRIVHVTLESEQGVTTESRGRGFHKRVAIVPTSEDERAAAGDS